MDFAHNEQGWINDGEKSVVFTDGNYHASPESLLIGQGHIPEVWVVPRIDLDTVLNLERQRVEMKARMLRDPIQGGR